MDLVRTGPWPWTFHDGLRPAPMPTAAEVFARAEDAEGVRLDVEVAPDAIAMFRPHATHSIDVDVDLRHLQGQERLDALCAFLVAIGRAVGRSVWMSPEGLDAVAVLGYDAEQDRVVRVDGVGAAGDG